MKCILGTKVGMTQVFRADGTVVPVTRVKAGPCVVTQVKTKAKDGVDAVQVGFGEQKAFRIARSLQGHLKGLATVRYLRDVRTGEKDASLKRGDTYTTKIFAAGEKVQVVGTSKGKGFQGVVRRHGFHGAPKTHGHKHDHRMPGSIGAGGVQRVFKDMRMAGRMGGGQVTVKNLEIVEVHAEQDELWIKGAVPGARGSLLVITTNEGAIEVDAVVAPVSDATPVEAPVATDVVAETVQA